MKRKYLVVLLVILIFIAAGLWALTEYHIKLPNYVSRHETHIVGQDRFEPGSEAHLRVLVRDSSDGTPLPYSDVIISLEPTGGGQRIEVFKGKTDISGVSNVAFDVPEDGDSGGSPFREASLIVQTKSELGSDLLTKAISIEREFRILLTTDKPIYQPGQMIHVRALALSTFDMAPASGKNMEIAIADGKGNKVFREILPTSEYGVAAIDFQLASEVNTGNYKITALLGDTLSEKTVEVKYYTLPKFAVSLEMERPFYIPGDLVLGSLKAEYFFGKPVEGGTVLLEGYAFDVERTDVFNIQGMTNEDGFFNFEFNLPEYMVGTDLEGGLGSFYIQASVTDQAQHTEITNLSILISEDPLVIEVVPESGELRPSVENILYIFTSQPDGTPVQTELSIDIYGPGQAGDIIEEVTTDRYGLAEIHFVPSSPNISVDVYSRAANGMTAIETFVFEGDDMREEYVLLRPDKPIYRVGETMVLTLLTSEPNGTIFLDIVRQGQTLSTRSVHIGTDPDLGPGVAVVSADVSPDLYGTLELHAYKILPSGIITRDTRLVVVDAATELDLHLQLDQESFRPGETANLEIQVSDEMGSGTQALLGLSIVDESVFAVAESDPGFAKLYFLLESELLHPRYDLHGYSVSDLVNEDKTVEVDQDLQYARETAAHATLANATIEKIAFGIQANSHETVLQSLKARQVDFFDGLFAWSLLLPLGVAGLSLFTAYREERLSISLAASLTGIGILPFLICPLAAILDDRYVPIIWGFFSLVLLILTLIAFRLKSWSRLVAAGVLLAYGILLFGFYRAGDNDLFSLGFVQGVAFLLGMLLIYASLITQFSSLNRKSFTAYTTMSFLVILSIFLSSCAGASLPFVEESRQMGVPADGVIEADTAQAAADAPRLRQYFPETLLWLPEAETDTAGLLNLEIPIADSITTWRMSALASTADGRLGNTVGALPVFQDFFIDLDLPQALTVGDEISVPVAVFNYLKMPQKVRLVFDEPGWLELLDDAEKLITIGANEIGVVYFRIRAVEFGFHPIRVTAWGSKLSDAIQKNVHVHPNGKEFTFTQSDRLEMGTLNIPIEFHPSATQGSQALIVKIYPGIASQVVEGLESILRMPNGCFEQTSSAAYPNIMVLDYLRASNQLSPEVQMVAENYINVGYQRLVTFEVAGGGFSLYGKHPADRMLTAYGLMEFIDMSRVHNVDPRITERTAEWLLNEQREDGSWDSDRGFFHDPFWADASTSRIPSTAYILWGLAEAGYGQDARTQRGLSFLKANYTKASAPYVLALVANAFVALDVNGQGQISATTERILDEMASIAIVEDDEIYWESLSSTFMGGRGPTADMVTTALATHALLRANRHPDLTTGGLTHLIRQKDYYGSWYSTQATVMTLKALRESLRVRSEDSDATVSVALNEGQAHTITITPEDFDVVQMIVFEDFQVSGSNTLEISASGRGNLMYQVSGSYFLPWSAIPSVIEVERQEPVTISLTYDRTRLSMDDTLQVDVAITMNTPDSRSESAIIDLGIPPGFSVETQDLDALITEGQEFSGTGEYPVIERYELTGRQILLYTSSLSYDFPLTFSYRLRAKFPLIAQTPVSTVYDYYNPHVSGEQVPVVIVVEPSAQQ
ncbi:MAG: hypothetical protein GTO18_06445 [Anaerolineales bacterium]|nr:hypothetical protein [Anaerolineales bacterium]